MNGIDDKTLDVTLRKDVKIYHGSLLTAENVAYTYNWQNLQSIGEIESALHAERKSDFFNTIIEELT